MWGRTSSLLTVITTLSGMGPSPRFWSGGPEAWTQAGFVPFKCVLPPLLSPGLLAQERRALKDGSLCSLSSCVGYRLKSKPSPTCCLRTTRIFTPHSVQTKVWIQAPLCFMAGHTSPPSPVSPCCGAVLQGRIGLHGLSLYICLWAVVDLLLSEFWGASDMLLEKNLKNGHCCPEAGSEPSYLCVPWPSFLPSYRSSAAMQCGINSIELFIQLRLRHAPRQ